MINLASQLTEKHCMYAPPVQSLFEVDIQIFHHSCMKSFIDITAEDCGCSLIRVVYQEGHFMPIVILVIGSDWHWIFNDFDQDTHPTGRWHPSSAEVLMKATRSMNLLIRAESGPTFSCWRRFAKPFPSYQVFSKRHFGNLYLVVKISRQSALQVSRSYGFGLSDGGIQLCIISNRAPLTPEGIQDSWTGGWSLAS